MTEGSSYEWDLFISHASEDKEDFVGPLAFALQQFGVKVWYDEYTLSLGDSLSRSIDRGLANSNFGVVVLSPAFLAKRWPEYELRGLTAREVAGGKIILPVWHNITHKDLLSFSPPLADKLAVRSDGSTPLQVAVRIIEVIRPDLFTRILRRIAHYEAVDAAKVASVATSKIKKAPIRHEELPADLISRIRLVRASLLDVYPHSMSFWLDGFQRDSHPSDEIAHWEHVASVFREYVALAEVITDEEKQKAFSFISNLWDGPRALEAGRSLKGAKTMIELYRYAIPAYDYNEPDLPEEIDSSSEISIKQTKDSNDREHFPRDLPEELIRDLMKSTPNSPSPIAASANPLGSSKSSRSDLE